MGSTQPRARPTVYAQRNAFPRPVLLLYAPQAPCQPIAKRHAAMEPLACKDQMRTQAPCQNEMQPQRTSLRVQVCNAGRRLHAARVRGAGVRQKHGSGHATHTAMASAALSSHSHVHARTGIISAGYGPVRTAVERRRARLQGRVMRLKRFVGQNC